MNKSPKKVIYVDIDEVLLKTVELWVEKLNLYFSYNITYEQVDKWNFSELYPTLSREQLFFPLCTPEFWKEVKPQESSQAVLSDLYKKYDVYLLTATHYTNVRYKYEFAIKRLFPFVDWKHMIVCQNKSLLQGFCMVDDNPDNLIDNNVVYSLLFSTLHNKSNRDLFRVEDWKSISNWFQTNELLY